MFRTFSSLLILLLPVMVLPQRLSAQAVTAPGAYDFSYLDRKISGWVDSGYYSGAAIVIARKNTVIHREYYGDYQPATVAYVASAGKWLAAATIASVVDEGKLSWDDPVRKWIPGIGGPKGRATLRQLLSHTAGYPDYQPEGQPQDHYQTLAASVAHLKDLPADTLPGTRFKYGGLAMQVAGRMAELATGKDWETLFQQKIARPLGMRATHFSPVDQTPGHGPMLGGGARTCLQDYAFFLEMISGDGLFRGKRILSARAITAMQADQVGQAAVGAGEYVEYARAGGKKGIYGLGEWRDETDASGQAVLLSSPGWAGAYPWIDKTTHTWGFFLARVKEMKNGFSSFLASPVLPYLVRDVLSRADRSDIRQGYITTPDHTRLYYQEKGAGEPLILLHGHSFDLSAWDPQFDVLARQYRVIRYDLRGYGWSGSPAENQQALHADDLLAVMDQLQLKKAHVVGLSLGGFVVTDFLALHAGRLYSATAASGDFFAVNGPSQPWTAAEWQAQTEKIQNWQRRGADVMKREWFRALSTREGRPIPQLRQPLWTMISKWDAWQPQHHEPRFLLGNEAAGRLQAAAVRVPVLVLTGEADRGHPSRLPDILPAARQLFVAGAGHVSNLENPEDFNRQLLYFLNSLSAGTELPEHR